MTSDDKEANSIFKTDDSPNKSIHYSDEDCYISEENES